MSSLEISTQLEVLLPRVIRALHRDVTVDPLREIPVAQVRVLLMLNDGPTTPSKLSAELGMAPSAISQVIKRLRLGGWVNHSGDDDDQRVRHIHLSEKGAEILKERMQLRIASAEPRVSQLSDDEQSQLISILQKLVLLENCADACTEKSPNK